MDPTAERGQPCHTNRPSAQGHDPMSRLHHSFPIICMFRRSAISGFGAPNHQPFLSSIALRFRLARCSVRARWSTAWKRSDSPAAAESRLIRAMRSTADR